MTAPGSTPMPEGKTGASLPPTPWTIDEEREYTVRDATGAHVLSNSDYYPAIDFSREQMAELIESVNSRAALLAEVERLRDALTNIDIWLGKVRFCDATPLTAKAHEIARAALAPGGAE